MSVALALYRAVWELGLALGMPGLVLRGRRAELAERLGHGPSLSPGAIWIHAASLGEMVAAESLVRALRREGIGPVALTAVTRTGRERGGWLRPDVGPVHLPLDAPVAVARFLDRLRPRALVLLETELWPNLLVELGRRAIPWAVASGRLSARGLRRLRPVRGLFRALLAGAAGVGARTVEDAERFRSLGLAEAAVRVTGDLKDDREVAPWTPPPDDRRGWTAACTRPGEEEVVLEAVRVLARAIPSGELILAPRHPERFEEVATWLQRQGMATRRWRDRDELPTGEGWSVLLVDEMGVLDEAYRRGRCAFVGGSLRPFGGHSPLEAAAAGRAILVGPHTENCHDAVERLAGAGALSRVASAAELADGVTRLLSDGEEAGRRGRAAHETARGLGGAAAATIAFLRARGIPW